MPQLRDRLRAWLTKAPSRFAMVFGFIGLTTLLFVMLFNPTDIGLPSDDEPEVAIIVPPASMADLIATPRPTPAPTPRSSPSPSPTPFPTPERMKSDVLTVSAPVPFNLTYDQWFPIQVAFLEEDRYIAQRTAWCESTFVVDARGALGEVGWFQIHPGHFGRYVDAGGADIDFASVGFLTEDERELFWVEPHPWIAKIVDSWFPGASRTYKTIIAALTNERVGMHVNAEVARTLHDAEGWAPWSTRNGCVGWQG